MDSQFSQTLGGLSSIIERFEQAWKQGEQPKIEEFLPDNPADRRLVLIELVHIELEFRLKSGEPARVEEYVGRISEFSGDDNAIVDLLARELELRRRHEPNLTPDEYRRRFPNLSGQIDRRLGDVKAPPSAHSKDTPSISHSPSSTPTDSIVQRPAVLEKRAPDFLSSTELFHNPSLRPDHEQAKDTTTSVELAPGQSVGRYVISRKLGQGTFGVVYRATDDRRQRDVALKVLIPTFNNRKTYGEVRSMVRCGSHPHIVALYDVGRLADGRQYICSQLIDGCNLKTRLAEGRLTPAAAAELIAHIADALAFAHASGHVHRDVKPANILLDYLQQPYLADFGLARADEDFGLGPRLVGTPLYMSPEQARRQAHRADGRSDIYSLGIVLYELLTSRTPYDSTNSQALIDEISDPERVIRSPRDFDATIPPELERICLYATAKDPARRYNDAEEMADDLRAWIASSPKQVLDSFAPGRIFGDYEILEELGEGGMGVVYKARQRSLKRLVALKTIRAGEFANADQILRFQAEAQSVARLNDPGIVPVYEVGVYRGLHFFSMQYLAGGSLSDRLKEGPLPARDGAMIVRQVAEAVHAAHQQQIIHRDLKPQNILLDEQGVPRVTDFGLAKQLDADDGLTRTGDVMGTPSYMAPEQAQGQLDQIGAATDVYALGAILYHVLTGRPPFQGASKIETLRQVVEQEPVPLRQLNAAIPRDLETIALKCLRKEVGKRYATAAELAADLGRWLENKPIVARPVGHSEKAWLWCKRRPTVAAAIALVAVTLAGSSIAIAAIRHAGATRQDETEATAAREQAKTVVASHLIAPATAIPYTLQQLKPLQQYATPLLHAKFVDESANEVERLHAAYGLAELGAPKQTFVLDSIPNAPAAECANIVATLQRGKSETLLELADRSTKATEPIVKSRYAIVALQLGDPQPVKELLALRPDPINRTKLIHSVAGWHGDLTVVADLLSKDDESPFRSGLCAALGTISWENIPTTERDAVSRTLAELYKQAPDGGTHSAAGWALRQWKQELPVIAAGKQPADGRQWYVNCQDQTMIQLPSDTFTMGTRSAENDSNTTPHEVLLTRPFCLGDREVTMEQFLRFVDDAAYTAAEKPAGWKEIYEQYKTNSSASAGTNFVTWFDAVLYCNWLSVQEGLRPAYERTGAKWKWKDDPNNNNQEKEADAWRCDFKSSGYRLPAEVEWEYACRTVSASAFCFGDDKDLITQYAWVVSNSEGHAWPGGLKMPNGWGLFDMHGNVREWCDDLYSPGEVSENNISRVLRGGAFHSVASMAVSAYRSYNHPDHRFVGFRPARTYP